MYMYVLIKKGKQTIWNKRTIVLLFSLICFFSHGLCIKKQQNNIIISMVIILDGFIIQAKVESLVMNIR